MTKREVTKVVASAIAQYGTGVIVYAIIRNNVAPTRIDHKVGVAVASLALGGVVAEAAGKHIGKIVDDVFDMIDKFKTA
jgi:hypothetical protein